MSSSLSNSSCSPSSSAVTIPTPGKSILKRPPPTQQSLFSRFTRFLPTPNQSQPSPVDESKPLKRAHFILPQIATVYPISSVNPPSTPTLKDEKRAIEDREAERRRRVVRGNSVGPGINDVEEWWNLDKVESFYRECCAGCDEEPDPAITVAFKVRPFFASTALYSIVGDQNAFSANPRSVDFSGVQLTLSSASILSDVFAIEWGLRKVVFRECDLDEYVKCLLFLRLCQVANTLMIDLETDATCPAYPKYIVIPVGCLEPATQDSRFPAYWCVCDQCMSLVSKVNSFTI